MAGSRQFKPVVWNSFSQEPIRPELGENPVTRVINMELTPEKTIRTRRGFVDGLGVDVPDAHVTAHLVNSSNGSDLIMQVGGALVANNNESITLPSGAFGGTQSITSGSPGFFSVYGGEVYYCQSVGASHALLSYDGAVTRNLGVPGLFGNYPDSTPTIHSSANFGDFAGDYCGYYCQSAAGEMDPADGGMYCCGEEGSEDGWDGNCGFGEDINTNCRSGANCGDGDPCGGGDDAGGGKTFLCMPQQGSAGGTYCWHVVNGSGNSGARGEKILNCAFKVGYYDPKRGIFGRACEPKSVINFGPNRDQYAMYQYNIRAEAPSPITGLGLAIWCSTGQEVMTVKIPSHNFWNLILYNEVHGMSDHLTDMMFLEDLVQDSTTISQTVDCGSMPSSSICLFKDQATLADSGQYTEQYERPVPSKAMAILPGGTALYFFPKEVTSIGGGNTYEGDNSINTSGYALGDHRPGIEYSVNHPEQIGRNTFNQKETFAPLPSLRGEPMYGMNSGGASLLFTRQSIYQLGFNGSPQIQDIGGPGVVTHKSIHPVSDGVMYVADEGPVWFKGGKAVEVLRELRFDGWLDPLTTAQRNDVRVGLIEDCKKLLMTFPIPGETSRYRVLMHDIGDGFTSEWWIGAAQAVTPDGMLAAPGSSSPVEYMISHRGDDGYSFYLWLNGTCKKYDPTQDAVAAESSAVTSCVEMWINENPHLTKQLGEVILDMGYRSGDVTLRVSTFENPSDINGNSYVPIEERTQTILTSDGQRYVAADFYGMQGKYIRVRVEADDAVIELHRVMVDIAYDEDPKTDDTPNVISASPGA